MTKLNEQSDEALEQHYARRKLQHPAPTSIKRALLAKQQNSKNVSFIFRRISYVAVAASTFLLISLLLIEQAKYPTHIEPELSVQIVQMHSLDKSKKNNPDDFKSRYANHYADYLAQKKTYAAHHKTKALLHLINDGWQLKTCDNKVVELSSELITALSDIQQIDSQITGGDTVDIAFDQSGIILNITRSGNYLYC